MFVRSLTNSEGTRANIAGNGLSRPLLTGNQPGRERLRTKSGQIGVITYQAHVHDYRRYLTSPAGAHGSYRPTSDPPLTVVVTTCKCKLEAHLRLSQPRQSINAQWSDNCLLPADPYSAAPARGTKVPNLQGALRCRTQERRRTLFVLSPMPVRAHGHVQPSPAPARYVNLEVPPRLYPAPPRPTAERNGHSRRAPATYVQNASLPPAHGASPSILLAAADREAQGRVACHARAPAPHHADAIEPRGSPDAPTAGPRPLPRTRFPRIGSSSDSREPGVAIYRTGPPSIDGLTAFLAFLCTVSMMFQVSLMTEA
ncbi:hypothetical protein LXA43DRAFT_1115380 [Ganoderma leucocontextum]|nr:hypothetical protein LXA43DRAFT_1115380 [Ganoderma leucocontextum]